VKFLSAFGRIGGVVLALVVTLLVFGIPVGPGMKLLYEGAFSDGYAWSQTWVITTPLLLCALGICVAWKAGMFNIGGEGQLIVGALFSATLAQKLIAGSNTAGFWVLPLLVVGALGGALYALFAGWLAVKRSVEPVISTILLNFIAIQALGFAVSGPLKRTDSAMPLSVSLPPSLMLPKFDRKLDTHWGVPIAFVVGILVYVWLFHTRDGFRLRAVGQNPNAARANGIEPDRYRLRGMAISGALCGLAGAIQYLGISGQLGTSFSQQFGFLAIPVALVGALNPAAVLGSSLFFGALFASTTNLSRFAGVGSTLVPVIQGLSVFGLLAFQKFIDDRERIRLSRSAAE